MKEIEISIKVSNGDLDPMELKNQIVDFIKTKHPEYESINVWTIRSPFELNYSVNSVVELEKNI